MSQSSTRQLEKILNGIPHVVWTAGRDGKPDFFSDQWAEIYGGTPKDLVGSGWLRFIHPADLTHLIKVQRSVSSGPTEWEVKLRILRREGSYRWALVRARPEFGANGRLRRWYGTCLDIHEAVEAQEALRESEELYRSVLEASADCIKIIDPQGRLQFVNGPGLCSLEIDRPSDILGTDWLSFWPLEARVMVRTALQAAESGKKSRFSAFCPTAKGSPRWWDVILTPISNASEDTSKILAVSRDITSQMANAERLLWASEHDSLTALPNRRAFEKRLNDALENARQQGAFVGLLLLDLDHFKHVNDSFGHDAGDLLLKKFTQKLGESVRAQDYVARLGGDEFAIILEGISGTQELLQVGSAISQRLSCPMQLQEKSVTIGASIGGALFPNDAVNGADLIKSADTAMYALKAQGRGGTKLFMPEYRSEAQRAANQLSLGRSALTAETVEPVYQPKIDLNSGAVAGYEALLRWRHPTFGLQHPESVAESFLNFELSTKIGRLMHAAVFSDMATGKVALDNGKRIAINASPAEFLRDDYAELLIQRLHQFGVSGSHLEIEITEQALAERHSLLISRAMLKLRSEDIKIALDDFGTGQSSLAHLRDFPVSILKIDRSFIHRMGTEEGLNATVGAILALGRSLNIEVVAQGIETAAQLEQLKLMGCEFGQGFLLGSPLPLAPLDGAAAAA